TAVVSTDGVDSGAAVQVASVIPVVTSSTASLAITATTLTINGFGFDPTAGNNTVAFNDGAVGTVTAATATSLTVTFSTDPTMDGNLAANATTITINGFGFDPTASNNSVVFNDGAVGTVTAATSTSLTVALTTE